jgi:predicted secreted hydrolase
MLLFALCVPVAQPQEWAPATKGYQFQFPRDHGQHPEHKIEWWYFTGNLQTAQGRRFGYQLTFFRIGVVARPEVESPWALRDVWMAHLAISDIKGEKYHHAERLNRAGPGVAGATVERVWNEDWQCLVRGTGAFELSAADRGVVLRLSLTDERAPVIHGEDGISQKGSTAGNASHYYSHTHLATKGEVTVGGETFPVTGMSWMDHEFGTSFLEKGQQGWDWFSGRFDDGSALMLFQLRSSGDGGADSGAGTLILPDGQSFSLRQGEFRLKPGPVWKSAETGGAYPIEWELEVPAQQIQLKCRAAMPAQEFRGRATPGLNYWEGAVDYSGTRAGKRVKGSGYLEMTGYGGQAMARWFGVGD